MEAVAKISCVLDACSIINLIHIDEDDFLIKKLKYLNIHIAETVFKEVHTNVFDKYENLRRSKKLRNIDISIKRKEIDRKLSVFRGFQTLNESILKDLGKDYFERIKLITGYGKENGEFYSACLALYISRYEPTKLFFHTDDAPAQQEFEKFFNYQQIGQIENTSDLLVLLYRLDDNFTPNQLDKILSDLFSEYASEVAELQKKLIEQENTSSLILRRDPRFRKNLHSLIVKLGAHDFKGIGDIRDLFYSNKSKYKIVVEILAFYPSVFSLESNSKDLLKKISALRMELKHIFCL